MGPFSWLDLQILDRVFQPLVNLGSGWGLKPYALGAFIGVGVPFSSLHMLVEMTKEKTLSEAVLTAVIAFNCIVVQSFLAWMVWQAAKEAERHAVSNKQTMNPHRYKSQGWRLSNLVMWPVLDALMPSIFPGWFDIQEAMLIIALYLVAVTWFPPMKRQSRSLPIGAAALGST
jgi:hypothetical protein